MSYLIFSFLLIFLILSFRQKWINFKIKQHNFLISNYVLDGANLANIKELKKDLSALVSKRIMLFEISTWQYERFLINKELNYKMLDHFGIDKI